MLFTLERPSSGPESDPGRGPDRVHSAGTLTFGIGVVANLTGTGVQVAPVASIDDRPVGSDGWPVSLDIQRRYFAAVRGTDPRYAAWLTPILEGAPR